MDATFSVTRDAIHALCSYVIAPARHARTGSIRLTIADGAIGTPPFDDGTRIVVRGDQFGIEPGELEPIATLAAAAAQLGLALRGDLPFVGTDLPPFEPDRPLPVDVTASNALADWYAFGATVLRELDAGEPVLWPEHFDLAVVLQREGATFNVGVSPGDRVSDEPYVYVGPWATSALDDPIWNASFGAFRTRAELEHAGDPAVAARAFVRDALDAGVRPVPRRAP